MPVQKESIRYLQQQRLNDFKEERFRYGQAKKDAGSVSSVFDAIRYRGHEECYPQVAEFMGIDPASEAPVKFDIADPKFMKAYFELVHHPHEEAGVDFWWIDWQQGRESRMPGLDPLWWLNHYHFFDFSSFLFNYFS